MKQLLTLALIATSTLAFANNDGIPGPTGSQEAAPQTRQRSNAITIAPAAAPATAKRAKSAKPTFAKPASAPTPAPTAKPAKPTTAKPAPSVPSAKPASAPTPAPTAKPAKPTTAKPALSKGPKPTPPASSTGDKANPKKQ